MPLEWRAGQDDRDVMGAVCTFPVFVIGWRCSAKRGRDNGVCDVEPLRFNRVIPGISSCMNRGCEFLKCGPRILCCEILLPDCHQPTVQLKSLQEFALYCELFYFASNTSPTLLCFLLAVGWVQGCDPAGAVSVAAGGGRGSLGSGGFEVAKRFSGEALGCGARRPRKASRSRKSPRGPASGALKSVDATEFRSLRGLSPRIRRGQGR